MNVGDKATCPCRAWGKALTKSPATSGSAVRTADVRSPAPLGTAGKGARMKTANTGRDRERGSPVDNPLYGVLQH
jgi:hypothetical protein